MKSNFEKAFDLIIYDFNKREAERKDSEFMLKLTRLKCPPAVKMVALRLEAANIKPE